MKECPEEFTVSVPFAMDAALQRAKCGFYGNVSQTEMLQDLIRRGLQAANSSGEKNLA